MFLLQLSITLLFMTIRSCDCSRGDTSDIMLARFKEERGIPISPVQAYRKKLLERMNAQPVNSFRITESERDKMIESNLPAATPGPSVEYTHPLLVPTDHRGREEAGGYTRDEDSSPPGPFSPQSIPSLIPSRASGTAAVGVEQNLNELPADYARSPHEKKLMFGRSDNSELLPAYQVTGSPDYSTYYKILNTPPFEANKPSSKYVHEGPYSPAMTGIEGDPKVVEFRGCLMKDFETIWTSRLKPGEAFVPRNEIESTCKVFIEKIEQLRGRCMDALETLMTAKAKTSKSEVSSDSKGWWRFLPFGK